MFLGRWYFDVDLERREEESIILLISNFICTSLSVNHYDRSQDELIIEGSWSHRSDHCVKNINHGDIRLGNRSRCHSKPRN